MTTSPNYWPEACTALSKRCRVLKGLIAAHPGGLQKKSGTTFQTLARAIVGQQISVKAAQTVWDRTVTAVGTMTPARVLAVEETILRGAGSSRQKISYLKDLAGRFANGTIRPNRWKAMSDEEVIADLTTVKGVGRWTAEMFLIFSLTRPNIFPIGDLGLVRAVERHFHDKERITAAEVRAYAERWDPWNTVATWYLWRSLDPIPVEY